MVSVAVRGVAVVLAVAANATVPFPVPLAPEVTVSQLALLAAVQAHPAGVVTVTEPVAAGAVNDCTLAEIV